MPTSIITRGSGVSIAGRQSRGLSPAFSRSSAAYQSDGRKVGVGVPRFEVVDGRRGVLIEGGTTNLVVDCSAFDTASWKRESFAGTITANATTAPDGTQTADQINMTSGYVYQTKTLTAGQTYTFSCWVKSATGADIPRGGIDIWGYNGALGSRMRASDYRIITPSWQRLELSYTVAADETSFALTVAAPSRMTSPYNVYVWGAQCEAKPYATSFVDGTRAAESLELPADVLSADEGTVELWITPRNSHSGYPQIHFEANGGTANRNQVQIWNERRSWIAGIVDQEKSDRRAFYPYDGQAGTPTLFTVVWSNCNSGSANARVAVYQDGTLKWQTSDVAIALQPFTHCAVGKRANTGAFFGNASYSQLRIHRRALTDEEIAAHAAGDIGSLGDCYHYPLHGDLWPAPGSLGAVVAPSIITRPGKLEVIGR